MIGISILAFVVARPPPLDVGRKFRFELFGQQQDQETASGARYDVADSCQSTVFISSN